ncbi:MAG: DUF2799 domain-containing protein [Proteobacteria bacterium]|nr:DUF2799 domain-containing protein [Pseudomonadota bacterium]
MNTQRLRPWLYSSLVLATLTLSGCTANRQNACMALDWQTVGYEDGVAGYAGSRIGYHRNACGKYGVAPNLTAYQVGREQGLREFCRPQNGFRIGSRGVSYGGVCPRDIEDEFIAAYDDGRQIFALESRVTNTTRRLSAAQRELDRVEHDIVASAAAVISADTSAENRAHNLLQAQQLAEKTGRLKAEIAQLLQDKVRFEYDVDAYLAANPPRY